MVLFPAGVRDFSSLTNVEVGFGAHPGSVKLVPPELFPGIKQPTGTIWCLIYSMSKNIKQSHHRPEVPRGLQEVKVPKLRDNGPEWW